MKEILKIAAKSTKLYLFVLLLISLLEIIGYSIGLNYPEPIPCFSELGEIFSKLSYSYISAFFFYFLTQRVKFAEDKIKYEKLIISITFNLKDTFKNFLSQLALFGPSSIDSDKINILAIDRNDFENIMAALLITKQKQGNLNLDIVLERTVVDFQQRLNYYINKALEYREFYTKENMELIIELNSKKYIEVLKHFTFSGDNLQISYLFSEVEKILAIQFYIKQLK